MKATTPAPTGQAILNYLASRGIRQNWVSQQVGMDNSRLNRFLKGVRYHPLKRDLVERIADALDVPAAVRREWLNLLASNSTVAK